MHTRINISIVLIVSCCLLSVSCKKYLDKKSNQALVVPTKITELQALLEEGAININDPGALVMSADDYYLKFNDWQALDEYLRRMYTWDNANLFEPGNNNDWANNYNKIYRANIVLDEVDRIARTAGDEDAFNNMKGSALFIRARVFMFIAWTWTMSYDKNTASTDLGIPLRLDANFNKPSVRSSLEETYQQIIKDLKEAAGLLPITPLHVIRPSKPAAYAFLARTYLSMRNYDSAYIYADKCLQLKSDLIDYNILNASSNPPIPSYNQEVIYHCAFMQYIVHPADSGLYSSYNADDLRKKIYFSNNGAIFQGSYDGSSYSGSWFSGVATDEVYLMRAECHARKENANAAMQDLNTLMQKRWNNKVPFPTFVATNAADALRQILIERRKELVYRSLRWMDIKRLNKEAANITLTRILNNQTYTLPPNDPRYALPIPEDVISLSGMPQNPR